MVTYFIALKDKYFKKIEILSNNNSYINFKYNFIKMTELCTVVFFKTSFKNNCCLFLILYWETNLFYEFLNWFWKILENLSVFMNKYMKLIYFLITFFDDFTIIYKDYKMFEWIISISKETYSPSMRSSMKGKNLAFSNSMYCLEEPKVEFYCTASYYQSGWTEKVPILF